MKRSVLAATLFAALLAASPATAELKTASFRADSAYPLPEGRFELGLFGPLRYGLSERVELSAYPLYFFVIPNISAKYALMASGPFQVATRHSLVYPTLLLGLVSREGTGGILQPTTNAPHILALTNEALITRALGANHSTTLKLGISVAPRFGGGDAPGTELETIDLPLIYARTAAYHSFATARAGIAFAGKIAGPFAYTVDADYFFMPEMDGSFAFEHATMLSWHASDDFLVQAGYTLVFGEYPFGTQLHVLPMIDLKWGF
ncbi:MAG: hypothetical protein H0U74_07295 [Bradymonadaceae bacterium]|nr:hypothetical protein [Lujinxingiaceae bacterium]